MCAQVIAFPSPASRSAPDGGQDDFLHDRHDGPGNAGPDNPRPDHDPKVVMETAFEVHEYARLAFQHGGAVSVQDRCTALQNVLTSRFGGELSATAEGYFELVYGCDPYTFLTHVSSYQHR